MDKHLHDMVVAGDAYCQECDAVWVIGGQLGEILTALVNGETVWLRMSPDGSEVAQVVRHQHSDE